MNESARALGHRAHEIISQGGLLLDVRTREEYAEAHLPKSINIPVQELGNRLAELSDKSRATVVYCRSGGRSATATALLMSAGFSQVYDLGAMSNW
ncbi:MAG: rhodanese-like domain-containing protein [Deltaproteobacteria bacterium]|nr:rhodanese-like domain-containing protein [Deltaproteobacteria bacterium]